MLVVNTNAKRQRRPNVRLGEIGDASAANFACGFSHEIRETFGEKRLKTEFVFPNETERASDVPVFNLNPAGLPPIGSTDLQHNRENNNPNSLKLGLELVTLNEINVTKPKLDFAAITRKNRVMKRRRTPRGNNTRSAWFSNLSSEDGKSCGNEDEFEQTVSEEYLYADDAFKDVSDHEIPGTSKNVGEYDTDEPVYDAAWKLGDSNFSYEGNTDKGSDVNSVRRWLEERGFGKYSDLFEMHEVDEEALPLLTIEDLKEMGMFAVGPRRKLYSAIQLLKGSGGSA